MRGCWCNFVFESSSKRLLLIHWSPTQFFESNAQTERHIWSTVGIVRRSFSLYIYLDFPCWCCYHVYIAARYSEIDRYKCRASPKFFNRHMAMMRSLVNNLANGKVPPWPRYLTTYIGRLTRQSISTIALFSDALH